MIIPGLKFHIDEGAKHRLYSFIDTYIGAGYQITVLLLFSYPSLKYLFKYKNYLREDVGWILMPCFGFSRGLFLKALTILQGRYVCFFLIYGISTFLFRLSIIMEDKLPVSKGGILLLL